MNKEEKIAFLKKMGYSRDDIGLLYQPPKMIITPEALPPGKPRGRPKGSTKQNQEWMSGFYSEIKSRSKKSEQET